MSENDANANLGDGGTGDPAATMPAFSSQLDGDLQKDTRLTSYADKNLSDFVKDSFAMGDEIKSLREASEGSLRKPGENATDDERQAFRTSLNKMLDVPESMEGYGIEKPDNLPEGLSYDETMTNRMLSTMHKHGAPKELVHALFNEFNEYNTELHTKFEAFRKESNEKGIQGLKDLWKGDFEKKNAETFEVLVKSAEKINIPESVGGIKGFLEDLENLGIKNNPRMNVYFNSLFDLIGGEEFVKGGPSGDGPKDAVSDFYPNMARSK